MHSVHDITQSNTVESRNITKKMYVLFYDTDSYMPLLACLLKPKYVDE